MLLDDTDRGRIFRGAWIEGVRSFYPGEPKPGYVAEWDKMPEWEQSAAIAVFDQTTAFLATTGGSAAKLTPGQKGRWIALCWIGQIYKHFSDPKPSYVADWDGLPQWQQKVDTHIFEVIEKAFAADGL
ncbi:hypothetical protein [Nocardia carnea]|uniref:hypothetical protein n=1 Tax=Nocardia carnea TaxID=37328 RepID=UPI002454D051|nr:hypothetical protein [Nocardia carnea]